MKTIELIGREGPTGIYAQVDDDDYDRLSSRRWYVLRAKGSLTTYARTTVNRRTVYMHQEIMGAKVGFEIDHEDGDGLNNQRHNLRHVSHSANVRSGYSNRAYDAWKANRKERDS